MIEIQDVIRLLAAIVAGAIVGIERELHDKPAGFRTNIMISMGAALFTLISERMAEGVEGADRTRIAAQIVTGVGFLGAGSIIQLRGNVLGLTTAATIWAVASIGMAFGAGEYLLGTLGTVLTSVVLFGLAAAEDKIAEWRSMISLEIRMDVEHSDEEDIERLIREARVECRSWVVNKAENELIAIASIAGPIDRLESLQERLIGLKRVHTVRRL